MSFDWEAGWGPEWQPATAAARRTDITRQRSTKLFWQALQQVSSRYARGCLDFRPWTPDFRLRSCFALVLTCTKARSNNSSAARWKPSRAECGRILAVGIYSERVAIAIAAAARRETVKVSIVCLHQRRVWIRAVNRDRKSTRLNSSH